LPLDVIVITGPTATGKTALGAALAKKLGGEVVSADSMQIYKRMDIGTAKPTADEMLGVPHHMIDLVPPDAAYSAARFVSDAAACVDDILSRGRLPVIVGGTGLYIDSLLSGRDFAQQPDPGLREQLSAEYDAAGGEAMLSRLSQYDPESARKLHPNDKKRIVRALEVYLSTGETISRHDELSRSLPPRYRALKIALSFEDRSDLYARIDARVDTMLERGLADEVRSLLDSGLTREHTAMQAIGYKEFCAAFAGDCTFEEAAELVKRESRRYAKRQLSWLRRDPNVRWILWKKSPDIAKGLSDSTEFLEIFGYNIAVDRQI